MKTKLRITAFLLILCMLAASFSACINDDGDTDASDDSQVSETSEEVWVDPAPETYKVAVSKLQAQKDFALDVEYTYERTADLDKNTEIVSMHIDNLSYGEENMASKTEKTVKYSADDEEKIIETYIGGKAYLYFKEEGFVSEMTAEEYKETIFPAALFDTTRYSEIKTSDEKGENGETVIVFSGADSVEDWAGADYSKVVSFSGKALIDAEGNLVSSSCEIEYIQGKVEASKSVSVKISRYADDSKPEIVAPDDADKYEDVESIEAPILLDIANREICDADIFQNKLLEVVLSQGLGAKNVGSLEYNYFDYDGKTDYSIENRVETQSGQSSLSEKCVDGKCTGVQNGKKYSVELTEDQFKNIKTGARNMLQTYLPKISHIKDASVEYLNGYIYITMQGNTAFDDYIRKGICAQAVGDGNFLDDNTDSYRAKTLEFTMTLDADSMLPVTRTVDYLGYHTLKNKDYELSYEMQSYLMLANRNTYYEITEKHHSDFETEPEAEDKAKPVFYKVTGANGETMWLLGTIHVGDNRTAYLPDEIYNAFDSSDAVAFEVNLLAALKDTKLLDKREKNSKYSGKDTIKDHISPELFEQANNLMTAFGLVMQGKYIKADMTEYKPYVWESYITNMYDDHGLLLSSDKGVDMRLILRAEENEQKIYEIEDREESVLRSNSYSDAILGYILDEAVNGSRGEYINAVNDLYNAWCEGDVEKIKSMFEEESDIESATEEEKKAYEEYEKITQTDRDAVMLNKAVEYLNSGETVFFAVGLAHLIDPESGLLKTLVEAGYTVELVTYA